MVLGRRKRKQSGVILRLNDDILHEIFSHVFEQSLSPARNPSSVLAFQVSARLASIASVCRSWTLPAQFWLFRHVSLDTQARFEQFLEAVTSRSYLKQFVLALSCECVPWRVSFDGQMSPAVPEAMASSIAFVDLAKLLPHLPRLHRLNLNIQSLPTQTLLRDDCQIVKEATLPTFPILWLNSRSYDLHVLYDVWPNVKSLMLERSWSADDPLGHNPTFSLSHFDSRMDSHTPSTLRRLLRNSVGHLEHFTLYPAKLPNYDLHSILSPHFGTLSSLSLSKVVWDQTLVDMFHSMQNLREIRLLHSLEITDLEFPTLLPDWIEHFTVWSPKAYRDRPIGNTTLHIPKALKSFTHRTVPRYITVELDKWTQDYANACSQKGIQVNTDRYVPYVPANLPSTMIKPPEFALKPVEVAFEDTPQESEQGSNLRTLFERLKQWKHWFRKGFRNQNRDVQAVNSS